MKKMFRSFFDEKDIFYSLVGTFKNSFIVSLILVFLSSLFEIFSLLILIPFIEILQGGNFYNSSSKPVTFIIKFLDTFNYNSHKEVMIFSSFLVSIIFFFSFFIKYFSSKITIKLTFDIAHDLTNRSYYNLVNQSFDFIRSENSSEYISLISSKITQIVYGYFLSLFTLINGVFIFAILLIFLLITNPILSLIILSSLLFIFGLIIIVKGEKVIIRGTLIAEKNSQIIRFIQETRGFIRQIFLYKMSDFFISKFKRIDKDYKKLQFENQWEGTYPKIFVESTIFAVIPIILIIIIISNPEKLSEELIINDLTLKLFVFLIVSVQKLLPVINQMYVGLIKIKDSRGSINDFLRLVNLKFRSKIKKEIKDVIEFKESIFFRDVNYSYSKSSIVFNKLNLVINKSDKLAVIGKSGSGKSTFIDLLSGLIFPLQGEILVDKIVLNQSNITNWSSNVSYIPQEDFFTNESIIDNILLGTNEKKINYSRLFLACRISLVDEFLEITKSGLQMLMGENGNKFSGGQKQRIGIARAIYRRSEIIIFDESTSALDKNLEERLLKNLFKELKKETIIFITHRTNSLKLFDKILEVKNGKINIK